MDIVAEIQLIKLALQNLTSRFEELEERVEAIDVSNRPVQSLIFKRQCVIERLKLDIIDRLNSQNGLITPRQVVQYFGSRQVETRFDSNFVKAVFTEIAEEYPNEFELVPGKANGSLNLRLKLNITV